MRILKKFIKKLYHLIWFLSAFLLFSPRVNAEIVNYQYLGRHVGDTFGVDAGNATDSRTIVVVPSSSTRSYLVVDICSTTADMVSSSVPTDYDGSYTTFYNVYNIKNACVTGNYTGVRVRMFYSIRTWADAGNGNFAINNTTRFYNTASYYGSYTILSVFLADSIDLGDLTINNQNIIINDISNIQSSINQKSQDIIDNNNQNSQNIINNNNQNSQNIINNQNENTDKEIESQQVCTQYDKSQIKLDGKSLNNSDGQATNSNQFGVTDYIKIDKNSIIKLIYKNNTYQANICFYNINKTYISCQKQQDLTEGQILTVPNSASYVRMAIEKSTDRPTWSICKNGNQALNDSVNDLNDNITDSSIDSSDDTINSLKNQIPTNSVISDLLLLPVRFLQNFVNALNSSCTSFSLGSLLGTNLVMPCINLESYLGSTIWTMIDLIFSGMFVYGLRKKFIQIYENITNLKNGGNEID